MKCVRDQNGNHVIQVLDEECMIVNDLQDRNVSNARHLRPCNSLSKISSGRFGSQLHFGKDVDLRSKVVQLAMHPYGCRVIQRILEHCKHDQASTNRGDFKMKELKPVGQVAPILSEIVRSAKELVHDQYGNYVVQVKHELT